MHRERIDVLLIDRWMDLLIVLNLQCGAVEALTRSFMLFAVASVLNCHLLAAGGYLYQVRLL